MLRLYFLLVVLFPPIFSNSLVEGDSVHERYKRKLAEVEDWYKKSNSRLKRRVIGIGDSHVRHNFGIYQYIDYKVAKIKRSTLILGSESRGRNNEFIDIVWIGPITMHRVGRDNIDFSRYGVSRNDVLVTVFGEIDVRVHIKDQISVYKRDKQEVIWTLAKNYIQTILNNRQRIGCDIVVCGVAPAYGSQQVTSRSEIFKQTKWPRVGKLEERIQFTKMLNSALKRLCKANNLLFFDHYDVYVDKKGAFFPKFTDSVHVRLKFNEYLKKQLVKTLLENFGVLDD